MQCCSLRMSNTQTVGDCEGLYGVQAPGRVTHGLLRLSTAMRSQAWEWSESAKLTPTQGEVLVLLMQRKAPMRLGDFTGGPSRRTPPFFFAISSSICKRLFSARRRESSICSVGAERRWGSSAVPLWRRRVFPLADEHGQHQSTRHYDRICISSSMRRR